MRLTIRLISAILISYWAVFATPIQANEPQGSLYDLEYQDLNSNPITLSRFEGRVVFLNFWATWCPPCVKEMPSMQRLREHFAGQAFEVVAVNMGETPAAIARFREELSTALTFPIVLDTEGKSYADLGLRGLPMTILYDHNGKRIETILGERDWDSQASIQAIKSLVEKAPSE